MKILAALFSITLLCQICIGQDTDSLRLLYNNKVIYRYGSSYMEGNNKLSFADLETKMLINSDTLGLCKKSKKQKRVAFVLNLSSLACTAVNILRIGDGRFNTTPTYLLIIGQMGFTLAAGQIRSSSIKTLDRAIWLRNREILFPR